VNKYIPFIGAILFDILFEDDNGKEDIRDDDVDTIDEFEDVIEEEVKRWEGSLIMNWEDVDKGIEVVFGDWTNGVKDGKRFSCSQEKLEERICWVTILLFESLIVWEAVIQPLELIAPLQWLGGTLLDNRFQSQGEWVIGIDNVANHLSFWKFSISSKPPKPASIITWGCWEKHHL